MAQPGCPGPGWAGGSASRPTRSRREAGTCHCDLSSSRPRSRISCQRPCVRRRGCVGVQGVDDDAQRGLSAPAEGEPDRDPGRQLSFYQGGLLDRLFAEANLDPAIHALWQALGYRADAVNVDKVLAALSADLARLVLLEEGEAAAFEAGAVSRRELLQTLRLTLPGASDVAIPLARRVDALCPNQGCGAYLSRTSVEPCRGANVRTQISQEKRDAGAERHVVGLVGTLPGARTCAAGTPQH